MMNMPSSTWGSLPNSISWASLKMPLQTWFRQASANIPMGDETWFACKHHSSGRVVWWAALMMTRSDFQRLFLIMFSWKLLVSMFSVFFLHVLLLCWTPIPFFNNITYKRYTTKNWPGEVVASDLVGACNKRPKQLLLNQKQSLWTGNVHAYKIQMPKPTFAETWGTRPFYKIQWTVAKTWVLFMMLTYMSPALTSAKGPRYNAHLQRFRRHIYCWNTDCGETGFSGSAALGEPWFSVSFRERLR